MPKQIKSFFDFNIYPVITEKFCLNGSAIDTLKKLVIAGAKIVQLREKEKSKKEIFELAKKYREITKKHNIALIINDHLDIALAVKADGVHLGQDDLPLKIAKKIAKNLIIGVSTHNQIEIEKAIKDGASYINIGPIFATNTKKNVCKPIGIAKIKELSKNLDIAFTVMGGIKEANIDELLKIKIKRIAMVTELTMAKDIVEKFQRLDELVKNA